MRSTHLQRLLILACAVAAVVGLPTRALAHAGAVPAATSWRSIATSVPAGVRVSVLDGDRRIRLQLAGAGEIVVLGLVGEPLLRITAAGAQVNAGSPTAHADQLVPQSAARGWLALAGSGAGIAVWHDHRISPRRIAGAADGRATGWSIPLLIDGRPARISGQLQHRPPASVVPWLVGAVLAAAAGVALGRRRFWQRAAAVAALTALAGALAVFAGAVGLDASPALRALSVGFCVIVWAAAAAFTLWGPAARARTLAALAAVAALYLGATNAALLTQPFALSLLHDGMARAADALAIGGALLALGALAAGALRERGGTAMLAAAMLVLTGCGAASVVPVPPAVGAGPAYQVGSTSPPVAAGRPVGGLACSTLPVAGAAHVELFVDGVVVLLPPGIGIAPPFSRSGAYARGGRCSYPVSTRESTGVVLLQRGARPTLRDLFAVWGQSLGARSLLDRAGVVRAWVDGRRWSGAIAAIPLHRHAEIVLEVGRYVPPHHRYRFPRGL